MIKAIVINRLLFYKKDGDRLFGHANWSFQQDGTSSHNDEKSKKWCKKDFKFFISKERWPSNSPELTLLDYSIWNSISSHVRYHKVEAIGDLHREVEKAIKKVHIKHVQDTVSIFLQPARSVERHNGELIIDEHG